MESLGNLARIEGFRINVDQNGKTVRLLTTDERFLALIQTSPAIDPSMQLGSDVREADIIETLREWVPTSLLGLTAKAQTRIQVDDTIAVITKRDDNVANPFVRFDVVKVL